MQAKTYEFYNAYRALKLHFTTDDYDIVKYQGKIKRAIRSPKAENYIEAFTKKFKRDQLIEYMVANFTHGDIYGGIYNDVEGIDIYTNWKMRTQNLSYNFKKDINTIKNHLKCDNILKAFESNGKHPLIMRMYLGKHIMLETVTILNSIYHFTESLNDILKHDYMWINFRRLVLKYQPFLNIDIDKYEGIIQNTGT